MKPILLHIPHASLHIPEDVSPTFLVDRGELERELLSITDHYTEGLFDLDLSVSLVFGQSRLVVDPERFEDDESEPMVERGMGALYTRTTSGKPLRHEEGREDLIGAY